MTMPILDIRLLGEFSLIYRDRQLTSFNTTRLQSLLAYLVLHRDVPQQRQRLAFLFWPDTTESQARNNLRQLLHQLRQALPESEHFLSADMHTLYWRSVMSFHLDVAEFEEALNLVEAARQRNNQHELQAALEQADTLYRGELLPGCYDEWILPERERLRQCYLQVLEQLLHLFEVQGDHAAAIRYAQRLIGLDPLSEVLARRLMHLFALNNDRASALRVYHSCVTALQRELGVAPDPATQAAYEQLMQHATPVTLTQPPQSLRAATSTLIGRKPEWEALQEVWHAASAGEACFVLVRGEAGIGKSRLTEEFLVWASQQGAITAKARSYAAEGQLSLAPVTDWLRSDALRPALRHLDAVWLTEIARLLPELFTEQPDLPRYEPVTEYGQRQRFFEALAHAILAAPQPLLLLIDDLQWCDQETLEWLHFLLRFDSTARLLIIGCAREEELPKTHPLRTLLLHLRNNIRVTELTLQPLDAAETAKLASKVANRELDTSLIMHLFQETEGYPLFVVEMVRANLDQVATSPIEATYSRRGLFDKARTLPPRVHAMLVGRLLQLSVSARELVECAAIIGREFTLDLVVTAGLADVESAVGALDELWHKRIVREHGINSYDFTHDKLREVAYGEISEPQRRRLHRRVAQALEAMHSEGDLDLVSGQIAAHYERAGMIEQALPFYQRAAAVAQHMYANEEAISLLSRGLKALELLPPSSKRDRQELSLQLALAPLYRVTKGWGTVELEHVLDRALALCETVGDDVQRLQTLFGLQSLYIVQAKLERVYMISDDLQKLYQNSLGTPSVFAGAMLAGTQLHLGRITEGNAHFAQIIAAHDPDQLLHIQESQGVNYAVQSRAWQAHALWCLGYPLQAQERGLEAVKMAQDLDQPFNQVLALAYLALLQQLCADENVARAHAEQAFALASTYKAPYYRVWASILVNYALVLEQPDEERIGELRNAIAEFKASSARLRLPYYLLLLAQGYGKAGRIEEGLATIHEALTEARAHNERWWDAELHRLRGEFLLMHGTDVSDIEAAFLRSIEIAQSQQARSLELRATMSLARLWRTQKRFVDGKRRLNDLYAWFTEGFETPDLQAARRLLAQL
ncbi:SARP family transcriptional regulator [Dictyobacter alpinus]|uniref:SARP family transcriptional regulator n=1 Tax=Dictyobacter alpinus TaxID=2014873 RepID=A0A402BF65_9CHLR|nr:AAA family ATPase [Dictyobacter alpinus]GCE29979.1 SARP family transcriptional regulator [Dictyobacter alpinus]